LQRKFIDHLADEDVPSRREAAKRAGYKDCDSAVSELMATPHVQSAAFRLLHRRAKERVRWRDLIDEAMSVLQSAIRYSEPDLAVKAASKVLDTAIKLGEESLATKAVKEDFAADSREKLAEAYLGVIASENPPVLVEVEEVKPTQLLLLNPSHESDH
jgi:hypothetical protein